MNTRIVNEVARIASKQFQHDYVLRATKEAYAVPEEMIDTVRGTISTILANPKILESLSGAQIEALKKFDEVAAFTYAELPWDSNTTARMIIESPEWHALRDAAEVCLCELCVNIREWESAMNAIDLRCNHPRGGERC